VRTRHDSIKKGESGKRAEGTAKVTHRRTVERTARGQGRSYRGRTRVGPQCLVEKCPTVDDGRERRRFRHYTKKATSRQGLMERNVKLGRYGGPQPGQFPPEGGRSGTWGKGLLKAIKKKQESAKKTQTSYAAF